MVSRSSLALLAPLFLGLVVVIFLIAESLSPSTSSNTPTPRSETGQKLIKTEPLITLASKKSRENQKARSNLKQFNSDQSSTTLKLTPEDQERIRALQNLSFEEITQKFGRAIGPTYSRTLPQKRRAQIFERFRDRLTTPLEPTTFLCWSEQTPLQVVEASQRAEEYAERLIEEEVSAQAFQSIGFTGRWLITASGTTGSYGTPITLTWSIAPDGSLNDDLIASNLIARLATIYSAEGANTSSPPEDQPWFPLFVSAFENISEETGIIFIYEENDDGASMSTSNDGIIGIRGDIRIFGANIDGNSGTLAYNYSPGYGDMVIDTADSFFNNKSNNSIRLRNTLGHEIGHGLGLGHVCPIDSTKLMEPIINTNFEGGQFDEVYSLQRRYGDHLERDGGFTNNDTTTTAGTLDLIPSETLTFDERLSIDDNSDSDFYRIIATSNQTLTATVTPTYEAYLEAAQNSDDSCAPSTFFDFSGFHDLSLQIRNSSNGILVTSNSQGIGSPETINYTFPTNGTYYLRVYGDSTDRSQIYSLSATLQNPSTTLTLTSSDNVTEEGNTSNTASVVVNSTNPVATPLTVTLLPSGSASSSDYTGDLTATIPAGQMTSDPVIISGAPDNLSEGSEILTLTIPVYSSGVTIYGVGSPSSQDITILNQATPFFSFSSSITTESFSGQNGVPDPNETLEVTMTLENIGLTTGTNVTGTLTGPPNLIPFDVVESFGTLTTGSSANASFIFGLTGSCGESISLDFMVNSDEGVLQNFPLQYDLGVPGVPTTEDMEHNGDLPPDWTSTTTGAGLEWVANAGQATSGTYSVFAASTTTAGSSVFTSPIFTLPTPPGSISFSHIYGMQADRDGAVLEISINGGGWQDILSAGGTFTSNGYNSVLAASSNPLSGRSAWSGSSGGIVTTTLDLPTNAAGLPVQLRWINGSDESGLFLGWYLDDIFTPRGDSCDTSGPALSLSASGTEISEGNPSQAVTLTVATDPLLPVVSTITLAQDSSGSTANRLTDVSGISNTSPVIPSGADSYTTDATAVFDTIIEGNETISLSYSPAPESVTISILDTPYALWALSNLGTTGNIAANEDFDLDGSPNIEEYAFQTLGNDSNNFPNLSWNTTGTGLELFAPPKPWPAGLGITGKASTDLIEWTETGVTETTNGFEIPYDSDHRFLQLFYYQAPSSE